MESDLETISMTWQQERTACPHSELFFLYPSHRHLGLPPSSSLFYSPQQTDKSKVEEDKLGKEEREGVDWMNRKTVTWRSNEK